MRQPPPSALQAPTPQRASAALAGLRTATGPLHAQLDGNLPIGRPEAVLADYIFHLQTLRPWLVQSQAILRATQAAGLGAAADRIDARLAKIDADLADAGQPAVATEEEAAPGASGPAPGLRAEAPGYGWGRAYVVEGSELGGRVLFKRLHARLAPHPLRYLGGDSLASPHASWQAFSAELEAYLATPARRLDAERGAVAAFSELLDSFSLTGRAPE
jgi:heme oxygenase